MYLPPPNDNEFELTPAGTHLAVCYRVIDLGTQNGTYMGQPKSQHKILLSWELPDEKMKDGRAFTISQRYTWSMSEKATLRKHLESWRGTSFTEADFGPNGFNIKNVIGKGCLLTITHAEKGDKHYANIAAVGKLMKGMTTPAPTNETAYLWLNPGVFDPSAFHQLSANMQAIIMQSPEYADVTGNERHDDLPAQVGRDEMDQEVPF